MKKPDLLVELNYRFKDISTWLWGALVQYESRSVDEINLTTTHLIEQNKKDLKVHSFHKLWDDFEDSLAEWINKPDKFDQYLNFSLKPKLEIAEYALMIGLISIYWARQKIDSTSHDDHLEAALCYAQALEAKAYWINLRGLTKCRNPDPVISLSEQQIKDVEMKLLYKDERVRIAKKAADARHSQLGGSRYLADKVREAWATGEYKSKNQCAEKVAPALGVSVTTARKALINSPKSK